MVPFLKKGSTIGLVAPAGFVAPEAVHEGIEVLEKNGFKVKTARHLFGKFRYFSGTVQQRIDDIHSFLEDADVSAIYAVRGGSGTSQLLPYLNYQKWRETKKLLIGFSDITALQWGLWQRSNVISFSGMTLTLQLKRNNPYLKDFFDQIRGIKRYVSITDLKDSKVSFKHNKEATGTLLGGTLSIICSLLGTPYLSIPKQDTILYLEDLNEELYRIERMMVQLKLAGILENVRAILFGSFRIGKKSINIWPAVKDHIPSDIPVILNFPYGHFTQSYPLIFGVQTQLKTDPFLLEW